MPEHPRSNGDSASGPDIRDGDFPFPLTEGPRESEYLAWLRNHSNYMAAQGFLDYFRAGAVLARGIIINLLIFIPPLLLVAIVLALAHHWMLAHPFRVTLWAAALGIGWILIFPALTRIFGIIRHGQIVQTGSASSVKLRDRYERSFGFFLLSLCALAGLESLPWVLEFFYDQVQLGTLTWTSGFATVGGALAVLSGSNRLLSFLSGVKKQVALVLVGALGLLVPLAVVLTAAGYLLYGLPPPFLWMLSPLAILGLGALAIVVLMPLALWQRAFSRNEALAVLGMLAASLILAFGVYALSTIAMQGAQRGADQLDETLFRLGEVVYQFDQVEIDPETNRDLAPLVAAGTRIVGESQRAAFASLSPALGSGPFALLSRLQAAQRSAAQVNRYLKSQLPLVSLGYKLSRLSDAELKPLRDEIHRLALNRVLASLERTAPGGHARELLASSFAQYVAGAPLVGERPELAERDLLPWVQQRFEWLAANPALHARLDSARARLSTRDAREISLFLTEADLAEAVREKFREVPGTAESAALRGRDSLARLLTRDELSQLVFPVEPSDRSEWLRSIHRRWVLEQSVAGLGEGQDGTRILVTLASLAQRPVKAGMRDSLSLALGFHALTNRFLESVPSTSSEPGAPATEVEIARAAGALLAERELRSIDIDYLRPLAFNLWLDPAADLQAERDKVLGGDSSLAPELEGFLEVASRPLAELATATPPPTPETFQPDFMRTDSARRAAWDRLPAFWPAHYRHAVLVAAKALDHDIEALAGRARLALLEKALGGGGHTRDYQTAITAAARYTPELWAADGLARIAAARFGQHDPALADELASNLFFHEHGELRQDRLAELKAEVTGHLMEPKLVFVGLLVVVIALLCWFTVDVNLTSVNGLYRDRLASAFLVGRDTAGNVDIEKDIDLAEICRYEAGSSAPYHLINTALNLQGSRDPSIRGRKSDFFIFSKRFIGGARTGYCRSEVMEQVFPQIDVGTAMAISAAAAAPNMGRATSPLLVAFMTLLNVRLGFWVPNPGRLEEAGRGREARRKPGGFTFSEVFAEELEEIASRRSQVYGNGSRPPPIPSERPEPTVDQELAGIGFSGGGIRSAALNLGITQVLDRRGVFEHLDYMSTVSGGGYLGSSISTLMRARESVQDRPRAGLGTSEIAGTVRLEEREIGERFVTVVGDDDQRREYPFTRFDTVLVRPGNRVKAGEKLIRRRDTQGARFGWRVRPGALVREILSKLDETHRWVNLSDGGHIENLAGIELLRRRCKYIILGDGECDPKLHFGGLAKLMRYASLDLGIEIDIDLDGLRLTEASTEASKQGGDPPVSSGHWAAGSIKYPPRDGEEEPEEGYLLYLKSSFNGDEPETIQEYRHRHPPFPHQSTADQAFDEDQFEAYRALGQHIAEDALQTAKTDDDDGMSFSDFEEWFTRLVPDPKDPD